MSHNLIIFKDVNGNLKKAKSIKLIKHPIRDVINKTTFDEPWVEIVVIGRVRGEWVEYIPLKDFLRLNPDLAHDLSL